MSKQTELEVLASAIRDQLGIRVSTADSEFPDSIGRLLRAFPDTSPTVLARRLWMADHHDPDWRQIVGALTVKETCFFRDDSWPDVIVQHVLQPLLARRRAEGAFTLRIWSAGCSTGEEPYTLAIILDQLLSAHEKRLVSILATDLDDNALQLARRAVYREWALRHTPQHIRDRYFRRTPRGRFVLDPAIRRMVKFATHNLASSLLPVRDPSDQHLIVCRNVLMYLTPAVQRAAARRLQACLANDGWLSVTAAEASSTLFPDLVPVIHENTILLHAAPRELMGTDHAIGQAAIPRLALPTDNLAGDLLARIPPTVRLHPIATAPARRKPYDTLAAANREADRGDHSRARAICERALRAAPLNFEICMQLARLCQQLKDLDAALDALRRALYLEPNSVEAHFLSAVVLDQCHRRESACASMRRVLQLSDRPIAKDLSDAPDKTTNRRMVAAAHAYLSTWSVGGIEHG